jgi:hypothetical protein
MNSRTALLSAVLSALALIASGASAATRTETRAVAPVSALTTLAKHGADDPVGSEDPGCDDRGTDVCAYKLSKHGADDAADPFDDHSVDVILAKHGADDLVDGEDDHGVDFILG